jgi:uncharacterized protein YyaL (SSP411 family)
MSSASCCPPEKAQSRNDLVWNSVNAFLLWLEKHTYESYDPYDIWGTKYGLWSRRLYYGNRLAGTPFVAPILLLEILCPQARQLFVTKQRFATADAQLVLAFLNLWRLTQDKTFLDKAAALARELEAYSIPGYSGHCWGYPFDWQHNQGLWKKNTPFITATPYCFEAFLGLHDATGDPFFLNVAASIARFVQNDLRDTPTSADAAAGSYSPIDNSKVINTSAYRAMVLFEAADRFASEEYRRTAQGNLNFILQTQRADGAWLYALDHGDQFIDHFHTCFVLKNLSKLNRRLGSEAVATAIRKGYAYYRQALYSADGLPRMYAIKPRTQIVRLEMYDFAEAINLGAVLRDEIPKAHDTAQKLAGVLCQQYQLPDGHFATRVYAGGIRHTQGYLRWPQAQLFHALTNLLAAGKAK